MNRIQKMMEILHSESNPVQNSNEPIINKLNSDKGYINASTILLEPNPNVSDILTNETLFDQNFKISLAQKECKKYKLNILILVISFLSILCIEYFLLSSITIYIYYLNITASIFVFITTAMFLYSFYKINNSENQTWYLIYLYLITLSIIVLTLFCDALMKIFTSKS